MNFDVIGLLAQDGIHLVILCPFCARIHLHGAGKRPDPIAYGERVPHCERENSGAYTIVAPPTPEIEEQLRVNLKRRAKLEKGVTL
jgi:hypothetical protein